MGIVYHGSKEQGLTRLEPRKSTHGTYVYATPEKALAVHFSARCGDDLVYDIGHFGTDKNSPWQLVELVPGAFEKMYSNSSSVYTLDDKEFKDINTGFCEVVSEEAVDIINEEYYENVFDAILKLEKEGLIKIYRYPNKPLGIENKDLLNKWRRYKNKLNMYFGKDDFERMIYLHPELLNETNDLIKEFGEEYQFTERDLINIFEKRIQRQIESPDYEQYIDCAYESIIKTFANIKEEMSNLYCQYQEALNKKTPFHR